MLYLDKNIVFEVEKGCISKMNGQKRQNILYLEEKYGVKIKTVEVLSLPKGFRYVKLKNN